jgi:HAMP domain-containing protein
MIVMGILGVLSIGIIGFSSYHLNMKSMMHEANIKSNIILNYAMASLKYMKHVQKPLVRELIEEDRFYPELMSGFVSARGTYEYFNQAYPDYIFKQATVDPLNPKNKADLNEMEIIEQFKSNPKKKEESGTIQRNGEEVYFIAQPIKTDTEKCLTCHGNPDNAPKDQIEIYGTKTGYNWKMDDTVAAFIVYVPIENAMETAKTNSFHLFAIAACGVLIMLMVVWFFLDRTVVNPILRLTQITENLSLGKNVEQPINCLAKSEIGVLGHSIERLRVSLVILFKKMSRKS